MGLQRTLQTIILSSIIAFQSHKSLAEIIDVPVYQWGYDHDLVDNAQSGDTINFIRGNYGGVWVSLDITDKNLTFESTDGIVMGTHGTAVFNTRGNSQITLKGLRIFAEYNHSIVNTFDTSSLVVDGVDFANGINYITHNSSGSLVVNNSTFEGSEHITQSGIVINNTSGNISVTKSFFGWNTDPIVINGELQNLSKSLTTGISLNEPTQTHTLNIANNTLSVCYDAGIVINGMVDSTGYIINNNITSTPDAIRGMENVPNVIIDRNNFYETADGMSVMALASAGSFFQSHMGVNYSFDPNLSGSGPDANPDSPLFYRGRYVSGLTTWFADPQHTYIGSSDINMDYNHNPNPLETPEPNTVGLLALGGAIAYLARRRQERKIESH